MFVLCFLSLQQLLSWSTVQAFAIVTSHHRPCIPYARDLPKTIHFSTRKDWDAILAAEDDDDTYKNSAFKDSGPRDMQYNARNCQRSARNCLSIRDVGGDGADLYGCNLDEAQDGSATFWYLGKVAWVSEVSEVECVQRQWNIIQHHAANLRPMELFGVASQGELQLWCAKADSEFDVAYNRPELTMKRVEQPSPGSGVDKIPNTHVGFQGEVYEGGEDGFRSLRRIADGGPSLPEIKGPSQGDEETEAPTEEQMAQLQEALKNKDINEVYEEQERRKREGQT